MKHRQSMVKPYLLNVIIDFLLISHVILLFQIRYQIYNSLAILLTEKKSGNIVHYFFRFKFFVDDKIYEMNFLRAH